MSEIQKVEQNIAAIMEITGASIVQLNSFSGQLDKIIMSISASMRGTAQNEYRDMINSFTVAQKKLENAIDCLSKANSYGNNWIRNHTVSGRGGLNQNNTGASFGSDSVDPSGDGPKLLTTEEVNARWKEVVTASDELIEVYRREMIDHGAYDGTLLNRFLAIQRNSMLKYESAQLDYQSGHRGPLADDEVYSYVLVGNGSPYDYSDLLNDFGDFCVQQVNSWVEKVNPNPNNDPRRTVNCGQCAAAVYKRMNGDDSAVAGLGTYSVSEMNNLTGKVQTPMTPDGIESYLRSQGAGAHVVVGVDRSSGAGHWFNAFFDGRQVYTIEGQGGYISGWPPDYGDVILWDVSI